MASAQAAPTMSKLSFAKVAASSYVPSPAHQNTIKANAASVDSKSTNRTEGNSPQVAGAIVQVIGENKPFVRYPSAVVPTRAKPQHKPSSDRKLQPNDTVVGESRPVEPLTKTPANDDSSTQVSSSDSSAKAPNFDKQSVASGTTFALDEKASLRPDDSVSTKAIEEEDAFTNPGTGAAGSRVGSDTDARAFSEQLHQIASYTPRAVLQPQAVIMRPNISFGDIPMDTATPRRLAIPGAGMPPVLPPTALAPTPDEKLLEAIESPRDRVYVLKIEQDILDFLKNEKDTQLPLPETNAFYRMLAHKLADYYGLEHAVQTSGTGAAVLITKVSCYRIPVPLSGITQMSAQMGTPPPVVPARKIMRRGDELSGTSTNDGLSKAGSEEGDGSDLGRSTPNGSKNKGVMTREEKEAKYAEARLRIFGNATELDATETGKDVAEDVSRTSSAAEKEKKKNKKQRKESNDDFEPRSQIFYHQGQYTSNGYPPETFFYQPFGGMVANQPPYPVQQAVSPPPIIYANGFHPLDSSGSYSFMPPQQYQLPPIAPGVPNYGQQAAASYDLATHFQQALQYQTTTPTPHAAQMVPAAASPGFVSPYMVHTQQTPGQAPMLSYDSYQLSQPAAPMFASERPMSSSGPPSAPYAYGQLPGAGYPHGRPPRHQHPVPGSYKGQPFNPQTQAFVPGGGRVGPLGSPVMFGNFNAMPNHLHGMQSMQPRSTPSTSNPSAYSSPRNQPATITPQTTNSSYLNNSYFALPSAPPTSNPNLGNNNLSSLPQQPPPIQQHSQALPYPPPKVTVSSSSIAKWGVPSHLPPKPPPPQDQHPQKFIEINRGLPPHTPIPGLSRSTFTSGAGATTGTASLGTTGAMGTATVQSK